MKLVMVETTHHSCMKQMLYMEVIDPRVPSSYDKAILIPMWKRSNESNHPEEDDVISDDERTPEEIAAAELRANKRRGMIQMHHSMTLIQASFRELDHRSPLLPHSRELLKRKRFILNLIRMI